jgi:site-specific DNA recombinase
MTRPKTAGASAPRAALRCAIYTRKSTEEGLDQDFNSLDAQRESAEAFIKSQAAEGWTCLPEHYNDGGFTGGNMERPALKRLLADVEAGRVDIVVTYKVDRLSRSLLDFARIMAVFDARGVSFVSVTQQFSTTSSMGRLTLNILLSFAQFEREIISERTRDKMAATRRKGKWSGGAPVLGYDVDARAKRLVVNKEESDRVRAIFGLYLEHRALLPVVRELDRRGWRGKAWTTRKGQRRGGRVIIKTRLQEMLTNPLYAGRVRYRGELFAGEQPALVNAETWQSVQDRLAENRRAARQDRANHPHALLAGLLRCRPCGCAMTPARVVKRGGRHYAYYVCTRAQTRGWATCPSKSVSAPTLERFVLQQLLALPAPALAAEAKKPDRGSLTERPTTIDPNRLSAADRVHLVRSRVEHVDYDGAAGKVAITVRTDEDTGELQGTGLSEIDGTNP